MKQLGLLPRVILALTAVSLLPLLASSSQLILLNVGGMRDQVLRTHAVAARTAAARVAAFLEPLDRLGTATARSTVWEEEGASPEAQRLVRDNLLGSDPRVVCAVVTNEAGAEVFRVQKKAEAGAVEEVLKTAAGGTLELVPGSGGRLWLRRSYAIPAVSGTLTVLADGGELSDVVRAEEIGDQALLAIGAGKDRLVLASSPAATLSSFPREMLENAASGLVSGTRPFRDPGGEEVLGSFAPIAGTDWYVVSRQPARVADEVARRMRRRAGWTLAGALVLTALLGAAALRTIVRPLREVVQAQRRLTGGAGGSSKGNEIAQLRSGLDALERQTADQERLGETFLGRYQVLKVIGAGGMGTVFRGWDPKLQRPVALKTVRTAGTAGTQPSERLVSELLHEAVTIARFSHPNIVSVYDVADSPEAAFIAMELVEGLSLHEYLKRTSLLPPSEVVTLGAAVASALAAAHAHRIVHHDVKPGNVLLGKDGSIKVTDFGIAQILSARASLKNSVFGTPGYIPPETIHGQGYDEAGDLFALGVVLYRCTVGLLPFAGKGAQAIMEATLDAEPLPPARRQPGVPRELDALIMGLLSKDKGRRPAPAGKVAETLEGMAARNGWRWSPSLWAETKEPRDEDDQPASGLFSTQLLASRQRGGTGSTATGPTR